MSNDLRSVRDASEGGNERAQLAYDMYSNSVKKYIGAYIAVMGGVDAIVLTAGVGENCEKMRRMIFAGLQPLGIILDEEKNRQRGFEREISADNSAAKTIIIPTNEEYIDRARHLPHCGGKRNRSRYLALQAISFCVRVGKNRKGASARLKNNRGAHV